MEKLEFIIAAKDQFSNELNDILGKLPSLGTMAAAAGAGIAAAGAALFTMTKATADAYDAANDLSERLGMTTEFISRMNYAGQMSGVTQEAMANSLKFLSVKLGEASMGTEEAAQTFQRLGVSIRDSSGNLRTAEELMPEIADGFSSLDSAAQRAALAQELFSRSGTAMIPALSGGKEGLNELWNEAEKFGLVISTKAADNAAEFNDAMDRMRGAGTGLKNSIAEGLLPTFSHAFNSFANIVADNRGTITSWSEALISYVGKGAEFIAYFGGVVADVFRGVHVIWEGAKAAIAAFAEDVVKSFGTMASIMATFLGKVNFGGVFDAQIQGLRNFQASFNSFGDSLGEVAGKAAGEVQAYWEKGMGASTQAVGQFVEEFKKGMGETVTGLGGGEKKGEGGSEAPDVAGNKAKEDAYQQHLDALIAKYDQYTMTEEGKIQAWYAKEAEIFMGHAEEMRILDETRYLALEEIKTERTEAAYEQWLNEVATEEEQLMVWYERQQELYTGNQEALALIDEVYKKRLGDFDKKQQQDAQKRDQTYYAQAESLASMFGGKAFALAKSFAIPQMIMKAYEASSNAMKDFPFPANVGIAALNFGMVMKSVSEVRNLAIGKAHAGLTDVPQDATYILRAGERVLAPKQNQDLTAFLDKGAGGGVVIERLDVHILENATDLDTLRSMDRRDWADLLEEKMIPALRDLKTRGVSA